MDRVTEGRIAKDMSRLFNSAGWSIVSNAGSLAGTTAVTALLGFVYWGIAARHFSPEAIAVASAALSAMLLLGTLASLGWGTLLIGELPRQPERQGALLTTAILVTATVGAVLGVLFAVFGPIFFVRLRAFSADVWVVGLFSSGVSLTAATLVLDQAVIGMLRGSFQFWRNLVFSASKLGAVIACGIWWTQKNGVTIYGTWTMGIVVSLVALLGIALRAGSSVRVWRPEVRVARELSRKALDHHILNLALQMSPLILPLLATNLLAANASAGFYIALIIANGVSVLPYALSVVLYAVGDADRVLLAQKVRLTVSLSLFAAVASNVFLLFGGPVILALFGHSYRLEGVTILTILVLGIFPLLVKDHFVAIRRIQGRVLQTAILAVTGGVSEVVFAAVGGYLHGATGLASGWLLALCIEAVLMVGVVFRAATARNTASGKRALEVPLFSPSLGRRSSTDSRHAPMVTVIVNNYNYGRFLKVAIDSALSQSYPYMQVIIVDDGSTDESSRVIDAYGERVTAILKENAGQASAFNAGVARCEGDIVIFLDADDALLSNTAEQVVHAFVTHEHVAKVQYRMEIIDADNHRTGVIKPSPHLPMRSGDLRKHVLSFPEDNTWMATSGNAFSTHVLRQIFPMPEEEFRILADLYLSQLTPLFGTVVSLDYVGAYYRMHGSNNFEGYTMDLARVRKSITYMANTHAYIQQYATSLHLEQSLFEVGGGVSVSFLGHRLVSLRLEPNGHPIVADSIRSLYRQSLFAVSRRFDVGLMMKLFYISWFTGVAFGPHFLVKWLAIKFFFPETRGSLNRVLGMLHRA